MTARSTNCANLWLAPLFLNIYIKWNSSRKSYSLTPTCCECFHQSEWSTGEHRNDAENKETDCLHLLHVLQRLCSEDLSGFEAQITSCWQNESQKSCRKSSSQLQNQASAHTFRQKLRAEFQAINSRNSGSVVLGSQGKYVHDSKASVTRRATAGRFYAWYWYKSH